LARIADDGNFLEVIADRFMRSGGKSLPAHRAILPRRRACERRAPRSAILSSAFHTVTFAKDQTPPVNGFWSLTLYSQYHFFVPNEINRYSVGTENRDLVLNSDGSITFYVQADPPQGDQRKNWLPAPKGADSSLFMRAYWPKIAALDGS
jgi:hypothetical protein